MDSERKKIIFDWFNVAHTPREEHWHKPYFDFIERDLIAETRTTENRALSRCLRLTSQAVRSALRQPPIAGDNDEPRQGTKTEVLMRLKEDNKEHPEAELKSAIQRAVRLALRVNTITEDRTAQVSPDWPDDKTVSEYARSIFSAGNIPSSTINTSHPEPDDSEIAALQARLAHRLTVVNIKKFTKIEIKETQYLPWHFKLHETYDYTVLYVFRDMRWLMDAAKMENFPVPREVIHETIESLKYLYPRDRATAKLFEQEGFNLYSFHQPVTDRPRLREFKYYRSRLVDVAYEFLNPPKKWRSIWKDRRNPMQFWTFWLGLLIFLFTLAFGIMATVLAGLQLHVALHPPKEG